MSGCPFDVGDVVVCVDADPDPLTGCADIGLRHGAAYRVAGVSPYPDSDGCHGISVTGVEVRALLNEHAEWLPFFRHTRFRKIDDGVTDEFRHQMRSIGKRSTVPA